MKRKAQYQFVSKEAGILRGIANAYIIRAQARKAQWDKTLHKVAYHKIFDDAYHTNRGWENY